jgi:hypothetical protein
MFTLTIAHPQTSAVTAHPSREVALAELHRFLQSTGHRHRVVTAAWTHADYEIVGGGGHTVGRAAIDEICACGHTARDHEEIGCTAISFEAGPFAECSCEGHRAATTEANLFAPEVPT